MTDPTPIGHVDDIAVRNRIIQAIRAEIADMDPDGDLADLAQAVRKLVKRYGAHAVADEAHRQATS